MTDTPSNRSAAARRVAAKTQRKHVQAALADIDPDYLAKLRLDCLAKANAAHPSGTDPQVVVEAAARDLRARLAFLREGRETP